MPLHTKSISSPVGTLTLVADDHALVALLWPYDLDASPTRVLLEPAAETPDHPILLQTQTQLHEYFAGTRQTFTVPLAPRGTPFQLQVWQALQGIPFGETRTYLDLARQLGNPAATRAVGAANGRNPISILIPCHRVVGASGHLTGFAGGLHAKSDLLHHESRATRLFA